MEEQNTENQSKSESSNADILSLLYLPLMFVYYELILRAFAGLPVLKDAAFPLFFGVSSGLVISGLISLFPLKAQKICTMAVLYVTALLFATECLIRNSFQFYMEFDSIFAGLGGVLKDYSENIVNSFFNSLPNVIAFFAPAVIYTVLGRRLHFVPEKKIKPVFSASAAAAAAVAFGITAFNASSGDFKDIYKTSFDFDLATEKFGLASSLRLSAEYAVFGNDDEAVFVMTDNVQTADVTAFTTVTEAVTETSAQVSETESSEAVSETVPEQETEAETAVLEEVQGFNVMDIDFSGIQSTNQNVAALNQYVQSLAPSNKNAYTGLFKGKNLILICAEAFSDAVIDEQLTPTLYRMSHNGFYFSEFYQPSWGGSTSTGEYSFITGLVPTHGVDSTFNIRNNNNYFTMGSQLQRLGYTSCAYHNGNYDFYNRNQTHINLGYDNFIAFGNGMENIIKRYTEDTVMINTTIDQYIDKQPFSLYYMTISGHSVYDEKNIKVTNNLSAVLDVYGSKYKPKTNYYLCYQLELEKALTELIRKLEEAGIADDTVICITSDHYPYGLELSNTFKNTEDYVTDLYGYKYTTPWEKDRNAWILWSGCLENELSDYACEISAPTYSLDIVPTLSNLFGVEYDSRLLVGRDVFSDTEAIALWNSYSWATVRGKYNAKTRQYFPNEGYEYDQEYIDRISNIVKNKIKFSGSVADNDYYRVIFG